ncbi:MAG: glycoside hydrolase [Paraglaciecola sp.]|nr:glycoside hydrolase [Paraglaciecola sp.]
MKISDLKSYLLTCLLVVLTLTCVLSAHSVAANNASHLKLNQREYYEAPGINFLVFSNWYNGLFSDAKMSGIELIQHGVRTATNGDVRLNSTPEQWDPIPQFIERKIDKKSGTVEAFLRYAEHNFDYSIKTTIDGDTLNISVNLPKPVPPDLVGKVGFNMEFIPSVYQQKSFISDEQSGVLAIYPGGHKEQDKVAASIIASGKSLTLAAEDERHRVRISSDQNLALYDGRAKAQNGWFVVRSVLPANKSGTVLHWSIKANNIASWLRSPVIGHSQLGYHPKQQKVAVIELDSQTQHLSSASLLKVQSDGQLTTTLSSVPTQWGQYLRYQYATFDFSQIREPGIYVLQYADTQTAAFRIDDHVYQQAWHPTLDVYMPVQMDHMLVNEAYRVWHGASHLDDALQAPVNHQHFDLYAQGPTTDSVYQPGEHVPHLNQGGWYDAGDYDIRTQTQYATVLDLVQVWEQFSPSRDTTLIDYPSRFVDLHVPDGKPDVLQQIEHGTLALLGQFRAFGRAINGIIVPDISQYTHLGDGLTMTDNRVYDKNLQALEEDGKHSGKFDDRWVFTSRSSAVNYGAIAALAAASRALRGFNDELSAECIKTALAAWQKEQGHPPYLFRHGNTTGGPLNSEKLKAALELLVSTKDPQYAQAIKQLLPDVEHQYAPHASLLIRALPFMDSAFENKIRTLTANYVETMRNKEPVNPFGVTITDGGWAGNGTIINQSISHYYMHKAFPALIDVEQVYRGLNYLYGTHPDSDISMVSNVGSHSKQVAYGMNRADFSFISGGIVPGILILKPDFPENKEDWPFLWGENEYVVNLAASYIFLVNAVDELLQQQGAD